MKSVRYLLLLSSQLALLVDFTLSLPIDRLLSTASSEVTARERTPSIVKGDHVDVHWSKRGGTEMKTASSHTAVAGKQEATSAPTPTEHASHKATEIAPSINGKEAATELPSSSTGTNRKPISTANYHAKAMVIESKKAGQELFHGPVRALTEVPVSGVIGVGMHLGVACRYGATCQVGKAAGHIILDAPAKLVMGTILDPIAVASVGVFHASKPAGRAAYHLVAMTGSGLKEVYQRTRGREPKKEASKQVRLEEAKKLPIKTRKFVSREASQLRTSHWNSKLDPKTGKVLSRSRSYHWADGIFGKNGGLCCFGAGGCGEGTVGAGTFSTSVYRR